MEVFTSSHLLPHPVPDITLCPAVFDLDDDVRLVGMGIEAFEAGLLGDAADIDKRDATSGEPNLANAPSNQI
jgi:hypothetical protein